MHYSEYVEIESGLKIGFEAPNLDLREIALVGAQLHRLVNKVAEDLIQLPNKKLTLYSSSGPLNMRMRGRPFDPLLVSLQITSLSYGSFSSETRVRIHQAARDLSIGVAGSLVATVIWSIAETTPKSLQVPQRPAQSKEQPQAANPRTVDVGPNIRQIATGMAATGKPWKLSVEDTRTGQKVIIESTK